MSLRGWVAVGVVGLAATWTAAAVWLAAVIGRCARAARRDSTVPDGYAAGRADLQLAHHRRWTP